MADRTLDEQLVKYLTDMHSIEEQALQQLRKAPDIAGDPALARAFEEHLRETERHEELVRERLEAHGANASAVKDLVMRAGGAGFLLFARLQPDTPGKLAAHAYSYEHLELAAYELLGHVATRAGDEATADLARRIGVEEQAMAERLAGLWDTAADASLRDVGRDDLPEQLTKYLADAHAIEAQAIQLLERAPSIVSDSTVAAIFEDHLAETRDQQDLVDERLRALGGSPSRLKDAAMRLGALNWGTFFRSHPDTPGKLVAFAYAFEHLEIGGYEQLKRVAQRAGDGETVTLADRILAQEREVAHRLAGAFERAAEASLEAVGVSP